MQSDPTLRRWRDAASAAHQGRRTFLANSNIKIPANRTQNNAADDTELYAKGQSYLNREEDVIGSVVGYVPLVSSITRANSSMVLIANAGWLCDNITERVPMAENGHDSVHGLDSCAAKRMSKATAYWHGTKLHPGCVLWTQMR